MTSRPCATDKTPAVETASPTLAGGEERRALTLKTGVRAGDIYMQNPRGSHRP